jgi:polyisoprenoid-binding protein YceI
VYVADTADVVVELTARALGVVPIRIRVDAFDAALVVEDEPLDSWLRADLDPGSVRTGWGLRDYVLRGPNVLDAGSYGVIRVESVQSTALEDRALDDVRLDVRADVYVKDLVTELVVDARLVVADPNTVLVAARTTIDRTALELTLPSPWNRLVSRRVTVRAGVALHRSTADLEVPS